nr:tyrosine-type recombinase/integrase [Acrocarpospora phusangensis]
MAPGQRCAPIPRRVRSPRAAPLDRPGRTPPPSKGLTLTLSRFHLSSPSPSACPCRVSGGLASRKEGLHQLRHYYASVMLAGAVSIKELAEYLGHADPGFTLRVYAHMMPGSHDRARQAIDDRLFRPRPISHGTGTEQ